MRIVQQWQPSSNAVLRMVLVLYMMSSFGVQAASTSMPCSNASTPIYPTCSLEHQTATVSPVAMETQSSALFVAALSLWTPLLLAVCVRALALLASAPRQRAHQLVDSSRTRVCIGRSTAARRMGCVRFRDRRKRILPSKRHPSHNPSLSPGTSGSDVGGRRQPGTITKTGASCVIAITIFAATL